MTAAEALTIALSVSAIVVSVLSLIYTLLWSPRPFIRVELNTVVNNAAGSTPTWNLTIANRGNAAAYDVRVRVSPGDGQDEVEYVGSLDPDQVFEGEFMITPYTVRGEMAGYWRDGPVNLSAQRAEIRWRTLPVLRIPRRMKVRAGSSRSGKMLLTRRKDESSGATIVVKATPGAI